MKYLILTGLLLLGSCANRQVKQKSFTKRDRKILNCIKELIEHDVLPKTANEICTNIYKRNP